MAEPADIDRPPAISNPATNARATVPALRLTGQDISQLRAQADPFENAVARLRVAADATGVSRAVRAARAFAAACALADRHADRVALVVEEWVTNVAEHAAAPAASRISVRLERAGDGVRLTVSDAGRAFDPRAAAFKGPNLARGGGAGLELVRAWAEIAEYRRARGRNRVVLLVAPPDGHP